MANAFIKAEQIVRAALGLLERQIVLPGLVWRNAGGDFAGAKDDTISIRLPAYANSRKRTMRSGDPLTIDELDERKVDVTLTEHIYKAIGVTDEELTLDIESFGRQVLQPAGASVARGLEDEVGDLMSGATYENEVEVDPASPYDAIVDARKHLNDASVPFDERAIVAGSSIEAALLKSEQFARADASGSTAALREAQIGRVAGFPVFTSNAIAPDEAYAFHRSAYVLSMRSPVVPDGATWGRSESFAGLAMRALRDYDFTNVRDRLLMDVFAGTNIVEDAGEIDANGKFVPDEDPDSSPEAEIFVRAVKLTLGS